MRQIVEYVREYFREEWNPTLFLSVGALLFVSFTLNYGFISEARIVRQVSNPLYQFVFYFFYYGIPYAITITLYARTTGKREFLSQKGFLPLTFFAIALLAAYITFHNIPAYLFRNAPTVFESIPREYHWYALRYSSNFFPGFLILIPLAWLWMKHDRGTSRMYGFSSSNINLKTYFAIILILTPIVFAASFGSDFQEAYPRLKFGLPHHVSGAERFLLIAGFEVCYGVDFVFVELLFRGFLVMAFARYIGSGSILPMVVVYAFIHFQKPLGEALGSIIGGFALGAIAYRTKSIYGGIILHLGVAYLMELAGALRLLF